MSPTASLLAPSVAAAAFVTLAVPGGPALGQGASATAELKDPQGQTLGTVRLDQRAAGVVVHGELDDLPAGWHAIHLHETGACTPDFAAAGGHFNPGGHGHGLDEAEPHAGDLPNIWAGADGGARFEFLTDRVALAEGGAAPNLLDADGAAVVVHAGPDDYAADPAGASGDRIACGVVQPS